MTENTDEKILERAQEIVKSEKVTLVEGMLMAEAELMAPADLPTSFTVKINVKPRVARWIMLQFQATQDHTLEERLAGYIGSILPRTRVTAMRDLREDPTIGEGQAVTLRRSAFQKQVPK